MKKFVFSSAELIADKLHSNASPNSFVVGLQSSGTGKGTDSGENEDEDNLSA